jgi:hypothetical protein
MEKWKKTLYIIGMIYVIIVSIALIFTVLNMQCTIPEGEYLKYNSTIMLGKCRSLGEVILSISFFGIPAWILFIMLYFWKKKD